MRLANRNPPLVDNPSNSRGQVDSRHLLTTGAGSIRHSSRTRHSMPLMSIAYIPYTR